MLYAISCWFKPFENSPKVYGLAICTDPDTPMTFIFPDGLALRTEGIYDYKLAHYYPWAGFDVEALKPKEESDAQA